MGPSHRHRGRMPQADSCSTGGRYAVGSSDGRVPAAPFFTATRHIVSSVLVVWVTTTGCRQRLPHLPPGLVPQLSSNLAPGQVVGEVVDSATRSALGYAQVIILGDSTTTSPSRIASAAYADAVGHFSLRVSPAGSYTIEVRHIGHRSLRAPLRVPDNSGLAVRVTLARDSAACATWPDLCK